MSSTHVLRNIESTLIETLADTPVTVLQGARQVGKSTLSSMVSGNINSRSLTFDSNLTLQTAKNNPIEFASQYPEGLLIVDEIQKCPEFLSAIKYVVDLNRRPGMFLITGSANILSLRDSNESLAGRAETIILEPFSIGELNGFKEDFVSSLTKGSILNKLQEATPLSREEYSALLVRGGYPDAQKRVGRRLDAFFENYLIRVLDHDANELSGLAHIDRLHTIFKILAANPSQIYVNANFAREVRIPESSMRGYIKLLEDLCLIKVLPAWGKNISKRAQSRPKVIVSDTGVASNLNDYSKDFLAHIENGNALGSIFEAFILAEILKQQTWSDTSFTPYHFRDKDGKEVDLILELRTGEIIAIEVKAASSFTKKDFAGMQLLREMLGGKFLCGILLYTGTEILPIGDKLFCAPASAIWQLA